MAQATEEQKAKMREYHAEHREERNAAKRAERVTDGERIRAEARARYERTKEARRDEFRRANRKYLGQLRFDVITAYGGLCVCCGADYFPHLTLDHIDGSGAEERRLLGSGQAVYRRLRKEGYPEGYQILCFNCNSAKHLLGRCACSDEG